MELLSPLSLAWLGLLVPLVLLYVLKRRRTEQRVGSTLLWEAALRDLRAERPWQRLRPHLSLLLQALALLFGAIALARPSGAGQIPSGARLAVVLDVSASMGAVEDGERRIDRASGIVRSLARDLPEGGVMMIVAAGAEPQMLAPPSGDPALLASAIDRVAIAGPAADLEAAVAVAAERMRGAPSGSRILVLTDACFEGNLALEAEVPVEVQRVGDAVPNQAIVAADVRARPTEQAPDRAELYVRLGRYAPGTAEVRLHVARAGVALATRRVTLGAGAPEGVVIPVDLPPDADGVSAPVELRLETIDGEDALTLDDVAVVASPAARRLNVFLVGEAPRSVQRVLRSDNDVELFQTSLPLLAERDDGTALDGLFVYSGLTPDAPMGDAVVVAPTVASVFGVDLGAPRDAPRIVSWDDADERLRFVRLADVHLGRARAIESASARSLVLGDVGPLVASLERPDAEVTLLAFDPDDGDWPRDPSFVVFFRNVLERARRRAAAGGIPEGALGEPLVVAAPEGEEVRVRTPSGHLALARSRGGVAVIDVPAEPGVYTATRDDAEGAPRIALRSLLDSQESDLRPRATFTRRDGRSATLTAAPEEHREAWPYLAGLMVLALLLEAVWATRRGAVA
ncbi:MAG: VWA domain-containing protein [Sandaracinaceae bacterium]